MNFPKRGKFCSNSHGKPWNVLSFPVFVFIIRLCSLCPLFHRLAEKSVKRKQTAQKSTSSSPAIRAPDLPDLHDTGPSGGCSVICLLLKSFLLVLGDISVKKVTEVQLSMVSAQRSRGLLFEHSQYVIQILPSIGSFQETDLRVSQ